jgi:hypothetical protein
MASDCWWCDAAACCVERRNLVATCEAAASPVATKSANCAGSVQEYVKKGKPFPEKAKGCSNILGIVNERLIAAGLRQPKKKQPAAASAANDTSKVCSRHVEPAFPLSAADSVLRPHLLQQR